MKFFRWVIKIFSTFVEWISNKFLAIVQILLLIISVLALLSMFILRNYFDVKVSILMITTAFSAAFGALSALKESEGEPKDIKNTKIALMGVGVALFTNDKLPQGALHWFIFGFGVFISILMMLLLTSHKFDFAFKEQKSK